MIFAILAVLPIVWVLFLAPTTGKWATSFGSAVHDPKDFLITVLNGVTAAALYFVVASGFTLIFGLMRVVNMAHGAFFLLGGYIALKVQRHLVGEGGVFGLTSAQVTLQNWVLPAIAGTLIVAGMGLVMQQLFLRWNQGQELRQALITIAISIILADQMLAHFGGVAQDIAWPGTFDKFVNLRVAGDPVHDDAARDPRDRGRDRRSLLWLWLKRTRTGMVIRAGVDDRAMVSALGINIQLTFAIAFFVGSGLAGLGGVIGGSFAGLAPGVDANWLLYSLVVVIIGGMGSLGGAAIGSLLLGLTTNFSAAYLPADYTYYSIIFTFVLVAVVLARAAARALREAGVSATVTPDRVVGVAALVVAVIAPLLFSTYWVSALLTQMLFLGIVAASLIFLSAYGGMVSLAQVAIFGIAGFVLGNATTNGDAKGLNLGWNPWLGVLAAIGIAVGVGLLFGALASRSVGIYFLMITLTYSVIANLFFGQVTDSLRASAGSAASRRRTSSAPRRAPEPALLHRARRRARRLRAAPLHRADAVRPDAPGRARRPGADGVARLQRRAPPHDRVRLRGVRRGDRRRALRLVERPHRPGLDRPRRDDRRARDRGDRRPLPDRGRLGRRALLRDHQQLLAAHRLHRPALPHADRGDLPRHRAGLARRPDRPLGALLVRLLRASPRARRSRLRSTSGQAEPSV